MAPDRHRPSSSSFPSLSFVCSRFQRRRRSRGFFLHSFSLRYSLHRQLRCSKNRIMEGGGSSTPFYHSSNTTLTTNPSSAANGGQKGDREAAIDAEMARVNKLPAHSSYAIHRMKVLKKLRHLLSIKRTTSQDEELELLFASLSI